MLIKISIIKDDFFFQEGRFWTLPTGEFVVREMKPSDAYSHISCSATHKFDPIAKSSNIARILITGK